MPDSATKKHFILASDFDQTLSYNDSGQALSEMLGITDFHERVARVSSMNLVQQGGELAYLLMHDAAFRCVRREHLRDVGKRVRLKQNIPELLNLLQHGIEGYSFDFHVVSAAPEDVIQSALDGIVAADHIHGTRFRFEPTSGALEGLERVPAGYGKVAVLDELHETMQIGYDRIIYVGDGSSDVHVMLHLNQRDGQTIAVSEARYITQVAQRTVISHDALSILIPILEDALGWESPRIRALFEERGFLIHEWDKVRTDRLSIRARDTLGVLRLVPSAPRPSA
jgi:2-hydroxy-3-keto-5-methylthiopentenyl-1-phosphate phosphatase